MAALGRMYSSRREMDEHVFHPAVSLLVPLAAVFAGAYLPKLAPWLLILDLPLVVVIFFAVERRSPISGVMTGALVGVLQDLLLNQPIGINGMVKAVVGYVAASISLRVDVDALPTRVVMNFGFCLLQSLMLVGIYQWLLQDANVHTSWLHELLRAGVNTVVGIPLFFLLDYAKQRA